MSSTDRKEELARKKAKLAALRADRLKRDQYVKANSNNNIADQMFATFSSIDTNGHFSVDELLMSVNPPRCLPEPIVIQPPPKKLVLSGFHECVVVPIERVTYSKETQTHNDVECGNPMNADSWQEFTLRDNTGMHSMEWFDDFNTALPDEDVECILPDVPQLHPNLAAGRSVRFFKPDSPTTPPSSQQLTNEDKEEIVESESFQNFFFRASRLIERAMDENVDIFFDYSGADRENTDTQDQEMLKVECDFVDENWSANRCVVALDWSPIHPELLLTAYSSENIELSHASNGVCLLWNVKYKTTSPEFVFTYQAEITSATLSEFNPSLVIGGTYGGQIILWDSRVNRRTPVQHSPMGGSAHVQPINALVMRGSQNAHNLISVSADGKLCSWSLDMLGKPLETLDLSYKTKLVTPTSLAFVSNDPNKFMVGSLDGTMYAGVRHGKQPGLNEQYQSHQFPITSISMSSCDAANASLPGVPSIILSTSMDCSVKLWSMNEHRYPIFSFDDRIDYIFDSDWSPIHPAVFATVDIGGQLDIWNLNNDHEVPMASAVLPGDVALNSCKFDKKGSHVAVGDDAGRVRLFDMNEKLAVPRPDDWSKLTHLVNNLAANISEQQEYDAMQNPAFRPLVTA